MKTYKLTYDFENYYSFTIKNPELFSKMPDYSPRFKAESRLNSWVTPNASFYASANCLSESASIPDITTWVTGNLVLSIKAYDVLAEKLKESGEFLPVLVEGVDYYIFNTLKLINDRYINKDKAREVIECGVNTGLENVSFSTNGLDGAYVFKSTTDHLLHTYCTESFKELLLKFDLKGLLFTEMVVA